MTGVSGAMVKHCAAGDDRGFMLFEVRHVPYKLRFCAKQSTNPYCRPAPRPERRLALFGAETPVYGRARLSGWDWR